LPILLLIAATASQLSAALADTIGGGGLLKELFHLPISPQFYYVLVTEKFKDLQEIEAKIKSDKRVINYQLNR